MKTRYITGLCLMLLVPHMSQADEPAPYTASYEAEANGLKATAKRRLVALEDGTYLLEMELEATVLRQKVASLAQSSRFNFEDGVLRTQAYEYKLGGVRSDNRSIVFDWAAGIALSRENDESWTLPLEGQAYDPLSHQYELRQALLRGERDDQEFVVIESEDIEPLRYRVMGEEVLVTPLGKLNTVKLERVREPNSKRSTVIWFATDWQYLLARIEQVSGSGLQIELLLDRAELAGETVTPLE